MRHGRHAAVGVVGEARGGAPDIIRILAEKPPTQTTAFLNQKIPPEILGLFSVKKRRAFSKIKRYLISNIIFYDSFLTCGICLQVV